MKSHFTLVPMVIKNDRSLSEEKTPLVNEFAIRPRFFDSLVRFSADSSEKEPT